MKPKSNTKTAYRDLCQTPNYALDPILPYVPKDWTIWEPAAGEGQIAAYLRHLGYRVITSDILSGEDFFAYEPDEHWDCAITNPPYSIKYKWLKRSYTLAKPFALLVPVETIGANAAQKLFSKYGFNWIFTDRRINFRMPKMGYDGKGAQFPTFWTTWKLNVDNPVSFAHIEYRPDIDHDKHSPEHQYTGRLF